MDPATGDIRDAVRAGDRESCERPAREGRLTLSKLTGGGKLHR